MAQQSTTLLAFNRGMVDRHALGRVDVKRIALSAETMTNWIPRVLGSMSMRPGWQYLGATQNNAATKMVPFVFSTNDTALLELTDGTMRVWINDALVSRVAVTTAVLNGTFAVDLSSWTQSDEVGGVSSWVTPGYMQLAGNGTAAAIRDQQVIVGGNTGLEHALRIVIARGPVTFRCGSSQGDDSYISETVLETGTHSLAFTPTGNFWIRFSSRQIPVVWVQQCTIEAYGTMTLPAPWTVSALGNIRTEQSADVVFVAAANYQQRRIERRGAHSWSIVLYKCPDGPFQNLNLGPITITPSALTGNITLTASANLFHLNHVGAMFQIISNGQAVSQSITAQNVFTNSIKVTGVGSSRAFVITISGLSGTTSVVTLQYSQDNATWSDVPNQSYKVGIGYVADTAGTSYQDKLDNQIIYYRLGIKTGDYASGTIVCKLNTSLGSITGVARITGYTSMTVVNAEVTIALGGTSATQYWAEGSWSDFRGWPTAVALHEGRMWWAGKNKIWGSVSDAFNSYDNTIVGDAGTIQRSIAIGPIDTINWLLSLQRLVVGTPGMEFSVRSSTVDDPLTPTNFNMKVAATQGSAAIQAVRIDLGAVFVNRSTMRVYQIDPAYSYFVDYNITDMTALVPELGYPSIVRLAVQRQPDTRIHCVRSDGTVVIGVMDKEEQVLAWVQATTSGIVEDIVILPALAGNIDDQVYYIVNRTINGATVRYLEKWSQELECRGGTLNKQADAFVLSLNGAGLSHLVGQSVVVWGNGNYVGTYTVAFNGTINVPPSLGLCVVGLGYTAQFKSSKLGGGTDLAPLNRRRKINHLGLVLADTHSQGMQFGPDFIYMDYLPTIEQGTAVGVMEGTMYEEDTIEFPGQWTTDERLCLQASAPYPCTVVACSIDAEIYK